MTVGNFRYPYLANPYPTYFPAQFQVFGSMYFDKLLAIGDHNPNDHIATYETGYDNPLLYSRYFYGEYGDLVIQGQSKTYTGNIHFVTGSNVSGDDPPTQRIIIMDNGNVGVGDYVSNPPKSKLQIKEGDVYVETIGTGVIIKSPNGTCWRMTVDNSGQMVTTTITCPN